MPLIQRASLLWVNLVVGAFLFSFSLFVQIYKSIISTMVYLLFRRANKKRKCKPKQVENVIHEIQPELDFNPFEYVPDEILDMILSLCIPLPALNKEFTMEQMRSSILKKIHELSLVSKRWNEIIQFHMTQKPFNQFKILISLDRIEMVFFRMKFEDCYLNLIPKVHGLIMVLRQKRDQHEEVQEVLEQFYPIHATTTITAISTTLSLPYLTTSSSNDSILLLTTRSDWKRLRLSEQLSRMLHSLHSLPTNSAFKRIELCGLSTATSAPHGIGVIPPPLFVASLQDLFLFKSNKVTFIQCLHRPPALLQDHHELEEEGDDTDPFLLLLRDIYLFDEWLAEFLIEKILQILHL
jgi:hypothetical protein